jgi:hypothetical protein
MIQYLIWGEASNAHGLDLSQCWGILFFKSGNERFVIRLSVHIEKDHLIGHFHLQALALMLAEKAPEAVVCSIR